jgi:hypothetical protein
VAVDAGEEPALVTAVLVVSCFLMAVLFTVIASWMQDQAFHRAARANLAAAACCALGGALVPFGGQTLPATVLVLAALLGATSFHAARVGRG